MVRGGIKRGLTDVETVELDGSERAHAGGVAVAAAEEVPELDGKLGRLLVAAEG